MTALLFGMLAATAAIAVGFAVLLLAGLVLWVPIILLAGAFKHWFANDPA